MINADPHGNRRDKCRKIGKLSLSAIPVSIAQGYSKPTNPREHYQ